MKWKVRALSPTNKDFLAIESEGAGELFVLPFQHEVGTFSFNGEVHRLVLEGISTMGAQNVYPAAVCYRGPRSNRICARILYEPMPRSQFRSLTRSQKKAAFDAPAFAKFRNSRA